MPKALARFHAPFVLRSGAISRDISRLTPRGAVSFPRRQRKNRPAAAADRSDLPPLQASVHGNWVTSSMGFVKKSTHWVTQTSETVQRRNGSTHWKRLSRCCIRATGSLLFGIRQSGNSEPTLPTAKPVRREWEHPQIGLNRPFFLLWRQIHDRVTILAAQRLSPQVGLQPRRCSRPGPRRRIWQRDAIGHSAYRQGGRSCNWCETGS